MNHDIGAACLAHLAWDAGKTASSSIQIGGRRSSSSIPWTDSAVSLSVPRVAGAGNPLIAGHHVPKLMGSDQQLRAIEMGIVGRPFILDFAGAKRPEEVPAFEEHVIAEHHEHLRELFGDRWSDALHVAEMFRRETGFVLLDIHPGNIAFADTE